MGVKGWGGSLWHVTMRQLGGGCSKTMHFLDEWMS